MKQIFLGLTAFLIVFLSACGLTETAATTANIAKLKAEEAKQAKQTKEQILQSVDQAQELANKQLKDATAAAEK